MPWTHLSASWFCIFHMRCLSMAHYPIPMVKTVSHIEYLHTLPMYPWRWCSSGTTGSGRYFCCDTSYEALAYSLKCSATIGLRSFTCTVREWPGLPSLWWRQLLAYSPQCTCGGDVAVEGQCTTRWPMLLLRYLIKSTCILLPCIWEGDGWWTLTVNNWCISFPIWTMKS